MSKAPDYETYKGHDLIKIYTGHEWFDKKTDTNMEESISFGVRKAKAVVANIEAIRKFAAKGE